MDKDQRRRDKKWRKEGVWDEDDLGIVRLGRATRRWLETEEPDYEGVLYDVDEWPIEKGYKDKEEERTHKRTKDQSMSTKKKGYLPPTRDEHDKRERLEGIAQQEKPTTTTSWSSWLGAGWAALSEDSSKKAEEQLPEDRIADVKFKSNVDVVCVDSSIASEQALRYAIRNVPKEHTLLLVHGIFTPPGAFDSTAEDEREMIRARRRFRWMCEQSGRSCAFRDFQFSSNSDLGEKVCSIAERQKAGSVIVGKRASISDFHRAVLGSPSVSVMQRCNVPVTLIAERKERGLY